MEPNHHESSCSEEETDRSEQTNYDMGTGRSYECVFCKRGFTSAQALGGHMNIHRKDRAKPRPSTVPSISSKVDDDYYASLRGYPPIQSNPPHYSTALPHHHQEVIINYKTFVPEASTWDFRPPHGDDLYAESPQILNPFDDWRRNLSLRIGPSHVDDNKGKTEDELDLELRLGHDP